MADAPDGRNSNWQRARAAQRAAEAASSPPAARPTRKSTRKSPDRWATLNEFVDVIAPAITKTEAVVWLLLFRHAKGGVVETSERRISTALQIQRTSAGRALRALVTCGLVWVIYRSTAKGAPSKYGIHPQPSKCLEKAWQRADGNRSHDAPG